jgi:predicted  nucleic acid-binding Zn-ribbon protein
MMLAHSGVAGGVAPVGNEFQVNTYTTGQQRLAAAAMEDNGDFVIVWQSPRDGDAYGIVAQRFSSGGNRLGGEFQVNSHTPNLQLRPAVGMDADGDFVVVWQSGYQDGDDIGVFARRFSSAGTALASEFQVNIYTSYDQQRPVVAVDDDGDFVVTWDSLFQDDGGDMGVFARRFASSGAAVGVEFLVNSITIDLQSYPGIAMDGNGDFVVAWGSQYQTGGLRGVFARRFSSAGVSIGEFRVNTYTPGSQSYPSVGMDQDGNFVIAWESYGGQDGDAIGLFAQRFASSSAPIGGEFQINVKTVAPQQELSAAMSADGSFVAVWNDGEIRARAFSSAGAPLTPELQVNVKTVSNAPRFPTVATDADGDFVVSWEDLGASAYEIFARRFVALATLDIDGDGSTEPLSDGLLMLRWHFGFTAAALVTGAVDLSDCTRCTAPAIEAYLAVIDAQLDIDSDGETEPLTDGLLALRWLFGFTGAALTTGAVDLSDCTRCNAAMIEPYLLGLD